MEHGARIEIRELPRQPHRGTESASQLTTVDRPLWRADLFDRLADPPGSFSAAHYHPRFTGNEPSARFWDAALSSDPWAWRSSGWRTPDGRLAQNPLPSSNRLHNTGNRLR